ncbi:MULTISPECIES: hypothetical protein [Rhizobium]|uniref:hypothetical protein n=1 Tax=Rhizobium TaxID=379 RepID=UPI001C82F9EA|nr:MULTISPECIES: hypothetical protein [Rhizobium]MBY5794408.1 hypothetical protein [Rhizobium leguminosarum]
MTRPDVLPAAALSALTDVAESLARHMPIDRKIDGVDRITQHRYSNSLIENSPAQSAAGRIL